MKDKPRSRLTPKVTDKQHDGFLLFAEALGKLVGAELYRRQVEAKVDRGLPNPEQSKDHP